MDSKMNYTPPMTEGGSPLPLTGYSFTWPIEMYMGYRFEDLIQKYGYRIQDAIRTPIYGGESGLDDKTMQNKTKWWKFWNRDLREAYKWYTGKVYYEEIINEPQQYVTLNDESHQYEFHKHRHSVPPSEDPTLAPEHHRNSAVKKKIKLPSPRMKPKVEETLVMDHIRTLNEPEPNHESDAFMKKYHRDHSCCPNCGSNKLRTSLVRYVPNMNKTESFTDLNSVRCEDCGFKGIRHDLVPKKRKPRVHEHTYELDGGPCTKCGKTVAETIYDDITNYKKNGKSK